jgi:ATP-dependent Lon protease
VRLRLQRPGLPAALRQHVERELELLQSLPSTSPLAVRGRHWLAWVLALPWRNVQRDPRGTEGFAHVTRELERSHAGRNEIKERIIEFLAVRQLSGRSRGTVLCLLGPPGVGKTSMARSVAAALGREFVEISLAGLHGESALRGSSYHREEGEPGLLMGGIARARSLNPVLLLDDLDQLARGDAGNANGALLELFDPARHAAFVDHYLGAPFDLSRCVIFAAASDATAIPAPLAERLEILEFPGYTETEKLQIAAEHLLPAARERDGLALDHLSITRAALRQIVRRHTEEAGVRQLQRLVDALSRKAALSVVRGGRGLYVRQPDLPELLGPPQADEDLHLDRPALGIATALAWTAAGGALLPVEILAMPGAGRSVLTGSVGDVLRESVQTAISYVRTQFKSLGVREDAFEHVDLHFHFPNSATPKDGPSAGLAIAIALASLLARRPVRHDVAISGELSLHGDVLPVGGIREKCLAALRAGLREVVLPARNTAQIRRLPAEVRERLVIEEVELATEAFEKVLAKSRRRRSAA